jgi:hypothetical protein
MMGNGFGAPVEVTLKLYGWTSGDSEVEVSIPPTSDLGRLLAVATPPEESLLLAHLRRRLVAELGDAFSSLDPSGAAAGGDPCGRANSSARCRETGQRRKLR